MGVMAWVSRLRANNGEADEIAVRTEVAIAIERSRAVVKEINERLAAADKKGHPLGTPKH